MKGLRLYLAFGAVLVIIYIIAQLNKPKEIDWAETYINKDKIPYGTYVLYNRLHDLFPGANITPYRKPVYNVIADDSIKYSSYIIICAGMELSKADYDQLIKYLKQGNDVFISTGYFGDIFEKNLNVVVANVVKFNNYGTPVKFTSHYLDSAKKYTVDKGAGDFYFNSFDTARAVVLGESENHKANFIKYSFGKGSLYLAADPKFFSNYSLLKPQGAAYAATALSFVKNTHQLVWDEYYSQGAGGNASFMRVFLSNYTLQWAYYITLFSLLLFVVYEIKRRQRIIPVIEPLSNSTLDFVTVVGQVYYENRNNADIAQKKVLYLLTYLRDEYQLRATNLDKEFAEKLTAKLGIDAAFAADLVSYMLYVNTATHLSNNDLIELNKLIEKFYIQAR